MTVRAEWHLAELAQADDDPFGMVIYSTGVQVDLTSSEDELVEAMQSLSRREHFMAANGLTCEFKDAGQECGTCPHASLDPTEARSALCRVGKDQETIWARGEALRLARSGNIMELAERVDEASEIGALSPELEEYLTSVGP